MNEHEHDREREERFMALLRPCYQGVERYALSLMDDRDDARDVLQDAIVIVWRKFEDLKDPSAFKSYLYTVLTNLVRRRYRRQQIFQPLTEEHSDTIEDTTPQPDVAAESQLVRDALQQLPPRAREAVILYEIEDMSVKEIAEIQRSTVSAVKVRLFRARKQLMKILHVEESPSSESSSNPSLLL